MPGGGYVPPGEDDIPEEYEEDYETAAKRRRDYTRTRRGPSPNYEHSCGYETHIEDEHKTSTYHWCKRCKKVGLFRRLDDA